MDKFKEQIVAIGRWIWEKDLTGGMSGNISAKIADRRILITGRGTCLGSLEDKDIGAIDGDGGALDPGFIPSSETLFHTSVYKYLDASAVVHVHPTFTNGYFAGHDSIVFDTFETRLTLGDIPVVDQKTPTITDIVPVIEALKRSNVIVLKHHGVVAIGETLKDAFFLAQTLEEAVKIAVIKDLYKMPPAVAPVPAPALAGGQAGVAKVRMFSKEQIEAIVDKVNNDEKFRQLATQTALETRLAVVQDETGDVWCFHFSQGGIPEFGPDSREAEFVISGKSEYWRAIFNRQLDPFAATTQKKLKLKGDFAKISRWYVPFNRLFELWTAVPVE